MRFSYRVNVQPINQNHLGITDARNFIHPQHHTNHFYVKNHVVMMARSLLYWFESLVLILADS